MATCEPANHAYTYAGEYSKSRTIRRMNSIGARSVHHKYYGFYVAPKIYSKGTRMMCAKCGLVKLLESN